MGFRFIFKLSKMIKDLLIAMESSERYWIIHERNKHYDKRIYSIHSTHEDQSSPIRNLSPFLDDYGIMRVRGRLS